MNMIERVARAIDPMAWCVPDEDYPAEKARREARQFTAISNARAAIRAMRAPTLHMVVSGERAVRSGSSTGYSAMIDAALQEDGK